MAHPNSFFHHLESFPDAIKLSENVVKNRLIRVVFDWFEWFSFLVPLRNPRPYIWMINQTMFNRIAVPRHPKSLPDVTKPPNHVSYLTSSRIQVNSTSPTKTRCLPGSWSCSRYHGRISISMTRDGLCKQIRWTNVMAISRTWRHMRLFKEYLWGRFPTIFAINKDEFSLIAGRYNVTEVTMRLCLFVDKYCRRWCDRAVLYFEMDKMPWYLPWKLEMMWHFEVF